MIYFVDFDTDDKILINPALVKVFKPWMGMGTMITFIDNSYIVVKEGLDACAEKISEYQLKGSL